MPTDALLIARFMRLEILQQAQQQVYNNAKSETTAARGKLWTAAQSKVLSHVSKAVKGL